MKAKLVIYEMKATIKRDGDSIILERAENSEPKELSMEDIDISRDGILKYTKSLSDFNQAELSMAKSILLANEDSREVTYKEKRLIE